MADEKIPALIERLLELTNQGKIGWEETADESTFQAAVGQYVVQVKRQPDETVEWGYSIQITDRFGRLLDESTTAPPLSKTGEAGTLLDQLGQASRRLALIDQLAQLWNGARRKALKTDEALSELLSSLDSM